MVNDDVTIRATVPDQEPVTLVVGRDIDVDGWVGDDAAARVTGLADWQSLAVAQSGSNPEAIPDPAGSDLWVAEASGAGSAEMHWQGTPGRWSVLAVGGGAQPQLELTWPRTAVNPLRWPLIGSGIALAALGGALALFGPRKPEPVPVLDVVPSEPVASDWSQIIGEPTMAFAPTAQVVAEPTFVAPPQAPTEIMQPVPVEVAPAAPTEIIQPVPVAAPPAPPVAQVVPVEVTPVVPVEMVEPVRVSVVREPEQPVPDEPWIVGQGRVFASSTSFDVQPSTRREVKMQRRAAELTGTEPILAAVAVTQWPDEWEHMEEGK